jgi:hypothetical protein
MTLLARTWIGAPERAGGFPAGFAVDELRLAPSLATAIARPR